MAKPYVQADALVYTAQPPFEADAADAWWTAFDALQMVDRELRDVDRVLRDRQKKPLVVRRVEGVHSPSRSEEHTSELQSLMRISYAVFCLKKKKRTYKVKTTSIKNNIKYKK